MIDVKITSRQPQINTEFSGTSKGEVDVNLEVPRLSTEIEITSRRPVLNIGISGTIKEIETDIGGSHSGTGYPVYNGPTTIIPEAYGMQILDTEQKVVKENIIVLPIPYFETSNPKNGITVYIGE